MGRFTGHESCPNCGSRDNLARYDDGGAFCFGCHYRERPTHAPMRRMGQSTEDVEGLIRPIPEDAGHDFSQAAIEWLSRFHVDVPTAIRNELVWSPSREQLIFKLGNCWQARNFRADLSGEAENATGRKKRPKNFTSGDVNECLHIFAENPKSDGPLVVVEDPVSALRIGSLTDSMPLLGSHLAQARLNAIAELYDSVVFWLDSDKYKEARAMEQRAKYMGLSARTIFTDADPKFYTNQQLQQILGDS